MRQGLFSKNSPTYGPTRLTAVAVKALSGREEFNLLIWVAVTLIGCRCGHATQTIWCGNTEPEYSWERLQARNTTTARSAPKEFYLVMLTPWD